MEEIKIRKSKLNSLWCWLCGAHQGNMQWGEYSSNGKTVYKCSNCWKPVKPKNKSTITWKE